MVISQKVWVSQVRKKNQVTVIPKYEATISIAVDVKRLTEEVDVYRQASDVIVDVIGSNRNKTPTLIE